MRKFLKPTPPPGHAEHGVVAALWKSGRDIDSPGESVTLPLRLVMQREEVGRRDLLLPPGGPGGSPKIPDPQAPEGAQRPSGEAGVLLPSAR